MSVLFVASYNILKNIANKLSIYLLKLGEQALFSIKAEMDSKVLCFACYGAFSCGFASIEQLKLQSGTCLEAACTSTCRSEVLLGQRTPETFNGSTASDLPRTLRRKALWPQEFLFENTDLAVHPSFFEICKDRETGIPAFPG